MNKIYEIALKDLRKSFDRLWDAVQSGQYGSRSLLGDELLNMKDAFDSAERHLTRACTRQAGDAAVMPYI